MPDAIDRSCPGVYLSRYSDLIQMEPLVAGASGELVIFKVLKVNIQLALCHRLLFIQQTQDVMSEYVNAFFLSLISVFSL